MEICEHCGFRIEQDTDGRWFDPSIGPPWDYECCDSDTGHQKW